MHKRSPALALSALVASALLAVPTASAEVSGTTEGCTPGYWKNHTDSWTWGPGDREDVTPSSTFASIYSGASDTSVGGLTLLAALGQKGGGGVAGAERILARAATAAWANAAHEGVEYPWRRDVVGEEGRPPLVETVNAAYDSGSRDAMLALAAELDEDNNLGCPLN